MNPKLASKGGLISAGERQECHTMKGTKRIINYYQSAGYGAMMSPNT